MWFTSWMKSVAANPKTTIAGLGALVGAAALGYGMSTGAVPLNAQTVATTGGLASAGFAGLLGKDSGGPKAATVIDSLTGQAVQITPAAQSVMEQIHVMKSEAAAGQTKVDQFQTITTMLAQMAATQSPATPSAVAPAAEPATAVQPQ